MLGNHDKAFEPAPSKRCTFYLLIIAQVTGTNDPNAKVIKLERGRGIWEEKRGCGMGAIVTWGGRQDDWTR